MQNPEGTNPPDHGLRSTIAVVASVAALIVASIAVTAWQDEPGPSGSVIARSVEQAAGGGGATGPSRAEVTLSEFAVTPGEIKLGAGDVTLAVTNEGAIAHTLAFEDGTPVTPSLASGESADLDLGTLDPGTYKLFCDVPGHEAAGMKATLVVDEEAGGGHAGGGHAGGGHAGGGQGGPDYAALDRAMTESILKFPAKTRGVGGQPLEPRLLDDGTKEFRLAPEIVSWEVEPGRTVDAWAYNRQVPGPVIRADVGDRLRVVVENKLPMSTDVHWHGVRVPNEMDGVAPITQELIGPGETFVYEFEAREPMVGMYHAHHHAQMQVPNGMLGTIIIGEMPLPLGRTIAGRAIPPEVELALELPMVLNDAGTIGYSLNGKSFPATAPVVVERGDWFLVHYLNEGLQIHPMHMHGFPQLVVAKDGIPLDAPFWSDTINVAPGERWSVLVHAVDAGTWVWHCHVLNHVEREEGMFGMVSAVVVQ